MNTDKYWKFLGQKQVNNISLDVYSNWCSNTAIFEYSYDKKGNKLWIQFQCVELVRRYVYLKYWVNLWLVYSKWDAKDWYENRKVMNLKKIDFKKAKAWDIITFQWGKWWHIAVINKVTDKYIKITSQNFFNNKKDLSFAFKKTTLLDWKTILDHNKNKFKFEWILRYKK